MSTQTAPDMLEVMREAQKHALAALEQMHKASLTAVEAAAAFVPAESWPGHAAAKPRELVETAFGFYGKVLESQKEYTVRLADFAAKAGASGAKKTSQ